MTSEIHSKKENKLKSIFPVRSSIELLQINADRTEICLPPM